MENELRDFVLGGVALEVRRRRRRRRRNWGTAAALHLLHLPLALLLLLAARGSRQGSPTQQARASHGSA